MKKIFEFGKIDYNGTGRRINRVSVEVELIDTYKGPVFTASGDIWNSKNTDIIHGGQCLDTIAEHIKTPAFNEILSMWKQYHLNDLHAGTGEQEAYIDKLQAGGWRYDYNDACEKLRAAGLYEIDGYKYGHGWIYRAIPEDDLRKIRIMLS